MRIPGFAARVITLSGASVASQVVVLLATPVLARLFSPADFGIYAVYLSLLTLLGPVLAGRYELAIPIARSGQDASDLAVLGIAVATVATALLTIVAAVVIAVGKGPVRSFLVVLPLALALWSMSVLQTATYLALRDKRYKAIITGKATQSLGMIGAQLAGGWSAFLLPLGLLVGDSVGRVAGVITVVRQLELRNSVRSPSWQRMRKLASRYRHFPLLSTGAGLLNGAGTAAPALLLAHLYGPATAGYYALTARLVQGPLALVAQSVGQVYVSEAGSLAHSPRQLRRLYGKTVRNLAVLGGVGVAVVAVVAPTAFESVLGAEWLPAGAYAQALVPALLGQFVVLPVSTTLALIERQGVQALWDAVRVMAAVGSLFLARLALWDARDALLAYALALGLSYAGILITTWISLGRPDVPSAEVPPGAT